MASHSTSHPAEARPSAAHTPIPVPITAHEAALLRRILSAGSFTGASQLLEQVRTLQLFPASSDAAFRIYIQHPETPRAPYSPSGRAKIPTTAIVRHPDGNVAAQIDVWVEGGHLRAMHLRWTGARVPLTMPNPDWVEVTPAEDSVAATTATPAPASATVAAAPAPAVAAAPPAPAQAPTPASVEPVSVEPASAAPVLVTPVTAASAHTPAAAVVEPARPAPSAPQGTSRRKLGLMLAVLCALAVIAVAFVLGRSGAADLAAARDTGRQAGLQQGAADGAVLGTFQGSTEGAIAGRQATYQPAFAAARAAAAQAAARAKARQAALAAAAAKRERAAAAAAAAAFVTPGVADNTTCSGYRDSRGYWICQ